jgi:hypothetical protein
MAGLDPAIHPSRRLPPVMPAQAGIIWAAPSGTAPGMAPCHENMPACADMAVLGWMGKFMFSFSRTRMAQDDGGYRQRAPFADLLREPSRPVALTGRTGWIDPRDEHAGDEVGNALQIEHKTL